MNEIGTVVLCMGSWRLICHEDFRRKDSGAYPPVNLRLHPEAIPAWFGELVREHQRLLGLPAGLRLAKFFHHLRRDPLRRTFARSNREDLLSSDGHASRRMQVRKDGVSCSFQKRTDSEHRTMEQDDGFGLGIGGVAEVEDIAVGPQAADDRAARGRLDALALEGNGDFAVVAHAHRSALAPDMGPPRAGRDGPQDRALFGQGLLASGVGSGTQFAVDFVLIGVRQELVEQLVGACQFQDGVGCQQGRQAFLPVVVAAFDFTFGLRGGGVAQGDTVEVEGRAQLGEGVGSVGEEKRMVVHVEGQRQAMSGEGSGQEVQVGQQGFSFIEAGAGVVAGGGVEQVEQGLLVGRAGQEAVGRGVILPEGAEVAGLPAFDGLRWFFVASVGGQLMFDGPATDAGTVGFEVQPPEQFAGGGAVGGGRFGGKEFGDQARRFQGPVGVMVAPGAAGRPGVGVALGAGLEVVAIEFIEAGGSQTQFTGRVTSAELPGAVAGQEMADEGSGKAVDELKLFIRISLPEGADLSL